MSIGKIGSANELTSEIRLLASKLGARLWRRNTGVGWIGRSKKFTKREQIWVGPGDVLINQARPFHAGETGQYDTYGWHAVVVTPDMVGQTVAVHVEIEIKFGADRESPEQKSWGAMCKQQGVRVGVARTLSDAEMILRG